MTEKEINDIIEAIFSGKISKYNLPEGLYSFTGLEFEKALSETFGDIHKLGIQHPAYEVAAEMRENTWFFSAAKTFKNVNDAQAAIFDEDGFIKPFSKFKKEADTIFESYNKNWLNTEYQTVVANSQMAEKWQGFEKNKEALPFLQYQTVGDQRVRDDHAAMDGVIRRVDDDFWSIHTPQNGWGCRCTVIQLDEGKETDIGKIDLPEIPEDFRFNPGKDKIVFGDEHEYFKVTPEDRKFKSDNFGLPLPEKL